MAILEILQYPHPILQTATKPVTKFDKNLKKIVDDMFETHYAQENCAALAANQLGIPYQITVIDFSEEKDQPLCLINPKIVKAEGETNTPEGCMSLLNLGYHRVKRAAKIVVEAVDIEGKPFRVEADGFLAKCLQHEIDHLNGLVYLNHLGAVKRKMIMRKISKRDAKT